MAYENNQYLDRPYLVSDVNIGEKIEQLISSVVPPSSPNIELYREMMLTVARMAEADRSRWEAKIMQQTLQEMEDAFNLLGRFKRRRKVTVFGSARTAPEHPLYQQAKQLGELISKQNMMVITGAGGGIMAAAHEGAGTENSLGLNIALPFEQGANATVKDSANLLTFHFFFLRKLFFVKEADALVLCPGGFGTLDEAWEVLTLIQTGKSPLVPVVLLETSDSSYWRKSLEFIQTEMADEGYILPEDMELVRLVHTPEEAVQEITRFYSNFHSTRWQDNRFVVRIRHELTDEALEQINTQFGSLCRKECTQGIQQVAYAEELHNEPEFSKLTRLEFAFNTRDFGLLRKMVDFINQPENWKNS